VTGSSGLIGTALVASLRADGHEVVRLVRRAPRSAGEVRWDPRAADAGLHDLSPLRAITTCVHLAGAGVASRRWTARYKAEIKSSRVLGTRALASALARLSPPPAVFVAASAIGYYGSPGDVQADESMAAGKGFLAGLVREWEAAADPAREAGIRVVHPRSGLVLTRDGGLLGRLAPFARLGPVSLCPRFGSGRQVMSWVSLADEITAIRFLIEREDIDGPVNVTAPSPVSNAEFTAALAAAVGRRDLPWLRVPAPLLRIALGEASIEILGSARIVSARLAQAGFQFRHSTIQDALAAEFS
jgi:uncharacterized protein (TIGR01777 family)